MKTAPFPFILPHAVLLTALGFSMQHVPADWEDVGGPESGPKVVGHPEYDVWTKGTTAVYVADGMIVEVEELPPNPEDFPF